jgi:hypothetical protein
MATELQIRERLDLMRSLPPQLARLESSLGTVQWPGEGMRLNFPSGMELSEPQRKEIEDRIANLGRLVTTGNLAAAECSRARLSLLTELLMGFPSAGNQSDKATDARLKFYLEAIGDVAPWALDAAIKRWVSGDVENANVDFAPSSGALRRLCETEIEPFHQQITKLKRLLSAVSIDRAMDPAPFENPISTVPRLRSV